MTNVEIGKILREMAGFYEMKNEPSKPRAYERAADSIDQLPEPVWETYKLQGPKALRTIPGVGVGIAEHLVELLKTGKLKKYAHFKKKTPIDLSGLTGLAGVGPKTARDLYQKLGVKNIHDLERVIASHKLQKIKGFGQKAEENLALALGARTKTPQRYLLGNIFPVIEKLRLGL